MALSKSILSDTGLTIDNAYIRIDEYHAYDNLVNVKVRAYVSKALKESGKAPIGGSEDIISLEIDHTDGAENPKRQICEHLKTLERYQDAVDC